MSQNPRAAQRQAGTRGNPEGDAPCPASHRYPGFSVFQESTSLQGSEGHPRGRIWGLSPGPEPRKEESLGLSPTWQPFAWWRGGWEGRHCIQYHCWCGLGVGGGRVSLALSTLQA